MKSPFSKNDSKFSQAQAVKMLDAVINKSSTFNKWWFFDTNCLSEIVKLYKKGHQKNINDFLADKDIVITRVHLQELRHCPDILMDLEEVLSSANVYLVAEVSNFYYCDLINFIDNSPIKLNALDTYKIPKGQFIAFVEQGEEFEQACKIAEDDVKNRYIPKVKKDLGEVIDERELCTVIINDIREYCLSKDIDIPIVDMNPINFPTFFTYRYTYYYRYVKNPKTNIELNDFNDLLNCLAVHYCERYYCENKFYNVLNNVKGLVPPTSFQIAKRMHKKEMISKLQYSSVKANKELHNKTMPLLQDTTLYKFSDMRNQILY